MKYLSGVPDQSKAQTLAMAAGSAFDAFVKSNLCHHIFGKCPTGYELESLLVSQVDSEILDAARDAGKYIFERYVICGAYAELLDWICRSDSDPKFEFTLTGEVDGIPLIGKPDCWFTHKGAQVVLDWKVNGYCGSSATSPKKLYAYCRDTWDHTMGKPTRGGDGSHKSYEPIDFHGMQVGKHWLDDVDKSWSDQLSIYTWMLGTPVGSETVVTCIDQIACKPAEPKPLLRVAQHRCRISSFWQHSLLGRLRSCWNTINSEHIFTDLTLEESKSRCEVLEMQAQCADDDPLWGLINQKQYRG
jgi:hypothetical protein